MKSFYLAVLALAISSCLGKAASAQKEPGQSLWYPVSGDWDGDGKCDVGYVNLKTMAWHLWTGPDFQGSATIVPFLHGGENAFPLVGDWDGDGKDTAGI